MLVLGRKAGDTIYIEDVKVKIIRCQGGRVQIGIDADQCVKITRGELVDGKKQEEVKS